VHYKKPKDDIKGHNWKKEYATSVLFTLTFSTSLYKLLYIGKKHIWISRNLIHWNY